MVSNNPYKTKLYMNYSTPKEPAATPIVSIPKNSTNPIDSGGIVTKT